MKEATNLDHPAVLGYIVLVEAIELSLLVSAQCEDLNHPNTR